MLQTQSNAPAITFEHVQAALTLEAFDCARAQGHMAPNPRGTLPKFKGLPPKEAAVLALVYPEDDGLHVLLTLRSPDLRGHSGQVSFPGGRCDPEDDSYITTALRETDEELGIREGITVYGEMSAFYIPPSHYNVHPVVGGIDYKPEVTPNPYEVAAVFSFRLVHLLDDSSKKHEVRQFNGMDIQVPYYLVAGHKVWGATAVMLSEFEHRLRTVL